MDTLAHALWAGAGLVALHRHRRVSRLAAAWLHIVVDVFTHSADYYPVPVLYPITYAGFDGIAWNTPWFMVLNDSALAATAFALWWRGR